MTRTLKVKYMAGVIMHFVMINQSHEITEIRNAIKYTYVTEMRVKSN